MIPTRILLSVLLLLVFAVAQRAHAEPHESAPLLEDLEEPVESVPFDDGKKPDDAFSLDLNDVTLSASGTKTTVQQAPSIVTVVTREEIQSRGYRTLNDLLQTIPGFEGDRWEYHGWTQESFARGNPRTLLVLLNGVNIVDPTRNQITLDRKIPMEAIQRVEIVSGPGGVLWGANALLGVVNVVTRGHRDIDGFEVIAGGGDGPGEQAAGKLVLAYGGSFAEGDITFSSVLSTFSSLGPELIVGSPKVAGVLPAPADDGVQLFVPGPGKTSDPAREVYFNWIGHLGVNNLSLEWMLPYERDARQISSGGALLTEDFREDTSLFAFETESLADDKIAMLSLQYQDRYLGGDLGASVQGFLVKWTLNEDPLGVFPPSDASAAAGEGIFTRLEEEGIYRYGVNLDFDLTLSQNQKLIFGGEVSQDRLEKVTTSAPITDRLADSLEGADRDGLFEENGTLYYKENLIDPVVRTVGALFVMDEYALTKDLQFSGGARLQLSDAYDPTVLFSGAAVWNLWGETYTKINLAEGFRPPEFQATNLNGNAINQITSQPNPNLNAERSRGADFEINSIFWRDTGWVDHLYLRADYSITSMDNIIVNRGGVFENSGERLIHSVESLLRIRFKGNHEIWGGYYFVHVDDSDSGPLRNIANHVFNAGAKLWLWEDLWEVSSLLTVIGPREDKNRFVDPSRTPLVGYTPVFPTDVFIEELQPVYLLRAGTRLVNIADTWTFSGFVYNALDQRWHDPDLFFDDSTLTRPYPKPRWSFFVQGEARF